jgi:hypothetical protein
MPSPILLHQSVSSIVFSNQRQHIPQAIIQSSEELSWEARFTCFFHNIRKVFMQITWSIPLRLIDIACTSTVLRWERICVGSCGYCIPDGCFPQWKLGVYARGFLKPESNASWEREQLVFSIFTLVFRQGWIFPPPKSRSKKDHCRLPFPGLRFIVFFDLFNSYPVQPWPSHKIEIVEGNWISFSDSEAFLKPLCFNTMSLTCWFTCSFLVESNKLCALSSRTFFDCIRSSRCSALSWGEWHIPCMHIPFLWITFCWCTGLSYWGSTPEKCTMSLECLVGVKESFWSRVYLVSCFKHSHDFSTYIHDFQHDLWLFTW